MTIRTDLKNMRRKLELGWTQGCYARDMTGSVVRSDDPKAVKWCMYGAAIAVGINRNTADFINRILETPVLFNDETLRTQDEVLAKLDELIGMAP